MKNAFFIIPMFFLVGCAASDQSTVGNAVGLPNEPAAEIVAYNIVRSKSIDPDNVEFDDASAKYSTMPDSSFVFIGLVRMPNKLGLKTPMNYNIVIKWLGGDWGKKESWNVEDCKIEVPEGI